MKNFEEIKVIGDGGFGIVTKCREKETGNMVAIKKMKQHFSSFDQCLQLKEVKSLRKIKHENVVRLLQVFRENEYLYLVFELLNESLLKTIQKREKPFTDSEVRFIGSQILNGLAVIHKQGFFHRDMKPDNLLWGEKNVLKIADFGLAREIRSRPPFTEYVGTRWYRAPEIILRHTFYNSPVDIWSVGCILMELYTLKPVFQGSTEIDNLYKYIGVLGAPSAKNWPDFPKLAQTIGFKCGSSYGTGIASIIPNASPDAIDLITQMLQWDPAGRPSAAHALQHRFFQGDRIPPLLPGTASEEQKPSTGRHLPAAAQSPTTQTQSPRQKRSVFGESFPAVAQPRFYPKDVKPSPRTKPLFSPRSPFFPIDSRI